MKPVDTYTLADHETVIVRRHSDDCPCEQCEEIRWWQVEREQQQWQEAVKSVEHQATNEITAMLQDDLRREHLEVERLSRVGNPDEYYRLLQNIVTDLNMLTQKYTNISSGM
jgi:hypothetical protein